MTRPVLVFSALLQMKLFDFGLFGPRKSAVWASPPQRLLTNAEKKKRSPPSKTSPGGKLSSGTGAVSRNGVVVPEYDPEAGEVYVLIRSLAFLSGCSSVGVAPSIARKSGRNPDASIDIVAGSAESALHEVAQSGGSWARASERALGEAAQRQAA